MYVESIQIIWGNRPILRTMTESPLPSLPYTGQHLKIAEVKTPYLWATTQPTTLVFPSPKCIHTP